MKTKRIEVTTTNTMFALGLGWGSRRQGDDHIAIILGCLVIKININI